MKISELIGKLTEQLIKLGDVDVMLPQITHEQGFDSEYNANIYTVDDSEEDDKPIVVIY
jgi:hypothetical protein